MQLAISQNSYHYKFFIRLKKFWGVSTYFKRVSLCHYAHVLFWVALGTVLLLPLFSIGWLWIKALRTIYALVTSIQLKIGSQEMSKGGFVQKYIQESSEKISGSPAKGLLESFLGIVVFLVAISTIFIGIFFGIRGIIIHIGKVPVILVTFVLVLSIITSYICWIIGFLLTGIGTGIAIGSTCLWVFLTGPGVIISYLLGSAIVIGFVFYFLFSRCPKVSNYFTFRYNGFEAAIKKREERRNQLIEDEKEKIKQQFPVCVSKFFKFLHMIFSKFFNLFYGTFKRTKGQTYEVLGIFPTIWLLLKSAKNGVCPIVEIIDDSEKVVEVEE